MKIIYINQSYTVTKRNGQEKQFTNGIEYAKYLRLVEQNTEVLVFTSFLTATQIFEHLPNSAIIYAIGHLFIQLPYSDEELKEALKEVSPLNTIQHKDIIINFCQVRSAVRESFHVFKGRVTQILYSEQENSEKISSLTTYFEQYAKELERDTANFPKVLDAYWEIINKLDLKDLNSIKNIIQDQEEALTKFLPSDDENNETIETTTSKHWEILFLDDRPDELKPLIALVEKKGIKTHQATTVDDATKIIAADSANRITVVVSDYRLLKKENGSHRVPMQAKQGYDFLLELSKNHQRFNALVALSGLSKWFLLDSFRQLQLDIKVYSKGGLIGGGYSMFVDDLEYLGDKQFEVLQSLPQGDTWSKGQSSSAPMQPLYVQYRAHSAYTAWEDEINKKAEKVARELEYLIDKNNQLSFTSLVSEFGGVSTTFKGDFGNKDIKNFKQRLFHRRVFLYLFLKGMKKNDILCLLQYGTFKKIEQKIEGVVDKGSKTTKAKDTVKESDLRNLLLNLAFKTESDIPYHILVEERRFLQHFMHLPMDQLSLLSDQSQVLINTLLNNKLNELPVELQTYIVNGEIKLTSIFEMDTFMDKLYKYLKTKDPGLFTKICDGLLAIIHQLIELFPQSRHYTEMQERIGNLSLLISKKEMEQA